MKLIYLISLIVLLIFGKTAAADTLFVSKTGANIPPFESWQTASNTVQLALDHSSAGDVVLIGEGEYIEKVKINTPIALIGLDKENCIIDCSPLSYPDTSDHTIRLFERASIRSLTIKNKGEAEKPDYCISSHRNDLSVKDCNLINGYGIVCLDADLAADSVFTLNTEVAIWTSAALSDTFKFSITNSTLKCTKRALKAYGGNFTIRNNFILGDTSLSIAIYNDGYYESMLFENNVVYGIEFIGIIERTHTQYCIYRNNLFYNTYIPEYLLYLFQLYNSENKIFENNVILNFPLAFYHDSGTPFEVDYNLYYNVPRKSSGNVIVGDHEITANPMFEKIAATPLESVFRLQKYSPAINAGNPEILDQDGTRSDIGPLGGPGGMSYLYSDLPPATPQNFTLDADEVTIVFFWKENSEADFREYLIYGGETINYLINENNLLTTTDNDTIKISVGELGNLKHFSIFAIDSTGNISPESERLTYTSTSLDESENKLIQSAHLYNSYPNPFNPVTKIRYYIPEPSYVRLSLFNVAGEKIEVLVDEYRSSGMFETEFYGTNYSSGVYFIRLTIIDNTGTQVFSNSRKIVLMK